MSSSFLLLFLEVAEEGVGRILASILLTFSLTGVCLGDSSFLTSCLPLPFSFSPGSVQEGDLLLYRASANVLQLFLGDFLGEGDLVG